MLSDGALWIGGGIHCNLNLPSSRPPVLSSQNLSLLQSARKMFHNLAILIESGISEERCCWPCAVSVLAASVIM